MRKMITMVLMVAIAAAAQAETNAEKLTRVAESIEDKSIIYDASWMKIGFPMGDVPDSIGVCADVVIRAFRKAFGWDLQQTIYDYRRERGMKTDTNIDHRRVRNMMQYFDYLSTQPQGPHLMRRKDLSEPLQAGDILIWDLYEGHLHIGIMLSGGRFIHNIGDGQSIDTLSDWNMKLIRAYELIP